MALGFCKHCKVQWTIGRMTPDVYGKPACPKCGTPLTVNPVDVVSPSERARLQGPSETKG